MFKFNKAMLGGIAFAVFSGVSQGSPVYQLIDLGDLAGGSNFSMSTDLNNNGVAVGYSFSESGQTAFNYQEVTGMQGLASSFGTVTAVSNVGTMAGNYRNTSYTTDASGAQIALNDLSGGGVFTSVTDMNNNGMTVGYSSGSTSNGRATSRATLWSADGLVTDLGSLSENGASFANGVNDDGTIVGRAIGASGQHAFVWENGSMTDLGVLAGDRVSEAKAINDSGIIVGTSGRSSVIWDQNGIKQIENVDGGSTSVANDINEQNSVVGRVLTADGFKGYLWDEELGMALFDNLLVDALGWTITDVLAINDFNWVAANATYVADSGERFSHAVLLKPALAAVSEPGSILILICAGFLILLVRRNKNSFGVLICDSWNVINMYKCFPSFRAGSLLLVLSAAILSVSSLTASAGTLAYWRFEGNGSQIPVSGTQVEDFNGRTTINTGVGIRAVDVSGNGNHLWAWEHSWAGFVYRDSVSASVLPQTNESNSFSVQNAGNYAGMSTWSLHSKPTLDIETVIPKEWTIEASIKQTSQGGHQTFVGREGNGVSSATANAPLYFKVHNGTLELEFTDMGGTRYVVTDKTGSMSQNTWYNVAAVSDGGTVKLYRDSGQGYRLVGSTALKSKDSRLAYDTAGSSSAGDTQWGWTVGRGRYSNGDDQGNGHTDRFRGFIDEVRISDQALTPSELLFSQPSSVVDNRNEKLKPGAINFILMPDTQKVARYDARIFDTQTEWIAKRAKDLGLDFVMHLGDIVDRHSQDYEWQEASKAIKVLEDANIPFSLLPGNHDVYYSGQWDNARSGWREKYFSYFGNARALKNMQTFGARDNVAGFSEYHIVEAQGVKFLVFAFGWNSSIQTLNWAKEVMANYSDLPTIVTTHQILDIAADETTPVMTSYGQYMWDNLIADNDQIFMTVNGHHHGTARQVVNNNHGKPVLMMVIDYQSEFHGGNGLMRMLQLDIPSNEVSSIDFSPWPVVMNKFGETQTHLDQALRTGTQETFNISFDLQQRFENITGETLVYPEANEQQKDTVDLLLAELEQVPVVAAPDANAAVSVQDYPYASETVAHWRFDNYPVGMPVPSYIPLSTDISGWGNDLMRVDVGVPLDDALVFSSDFAPASSSKGSVCLKGDKGGSFLSTMEGMSLAFENFPNGYTIEAFFKISPQWNYDDNRWAGIFAQHGDGYATGKNQGDLSEPQANLGISSLREIFWSLWPDNKGYRDTSWSWTIGRNKWHHVAAVNKDGRVKLYIDGVTDFRNPAWNDAMGIAPSLFGKGYLIGANNSYGEYSIFNGCIGEVRITSRGLDPSEFLFRRVSN